MKYYLIMLEIVIAAVFIVICFWFILNAVAKDINKPIETTTVEVISDRNREIQKITYMRVTAYLPTGSKTALGDDVVTGKTAAVSPNCSYLLGEWVYIRGHGVRYVNDVTAKWLDDNFDYCTLDIAVPTKKDAARIGNEIKAVIHLPRYH